MSYCVGAQFRRGNPMVIRRLRGLLATTFGGAVVGAAAGAVLGVAFWVMSMILAPTMSHRTLAPQHAAAGILLATVWVAIVGAVGGGVFGVLVLMAERGRRIAELPAPRIAMWAAIASMAALRIGGATWPLVGLGAALGAAIGYGATSAAKRAGEAEANPEMIAPPT
jgi:hypothetical protein